MSTLQTRVSRGIPAGGQFAATVHAEPNLDLTAAADPQVQANLDRPAPVVTPEQAQSLRRRRTPLKDAAARQGVTLSPGYQVRDAVRAIQDRLNGR